MHGFRFALSTLFAVVAVAGCGASVHTTTMPNANLSAYRTFAFKSSDETMVDQTIRNEVTRHLEAKGLQQAPDNPDFFIVQRVVTEEKVSVSGGDRYYGGYYGVYGGPGVVREYTEGTLIVDFIDARTNQVFWRGTATEVASHPNNPDLKKVAAAVDKLIARYPSQVAGAPAPARM